MRPVFHSHFLPAPDVGGVALLDAGMSNGYLNVQVLR
jgi:hypothetical protein